ncbi:MAG: MFS transporter [Anaerolineaceae bacterium]|nr:MFS transporter [Anaerolineaceae bacterium]
MQSIFRRINLNSNITILLFEAGFIGVMITSEPFLPVFLTRLGATPFQISLLTTMPAIAGLLLTIPVGQMLVNAGRIIDWYRYPRLAGSVAFILAAIVPFIFHSYHTSITLIIIIFGLASIPSIILMITFSLVMNAISGPRGRYEVMAKRMSIVVLTSAVCMALAGWFLEQVVFPRNFQWLFIIFSVIGGGVAFYFSSSIQLPKHVVPRLPAPSLMTTLRGYRNILQGNRNFSSFVWIRFVFIVGLMMSVPIIPIYYVRVAKASDAWIGMITMVQLGVMVFGYYFWMRKARSHMPNHTILLQTTLVLALYPALIALTDRVALIILITGLAFFFQAGLDLVFFDELMRSVPVKESIPYISLATSIQYIGTIAGPLLGSFLAEQFSLSTALFVAAGIRAVAFLLFFFRPDSPLEEEEEPELETQSIHEVAPLPLPQP